MHKITIKCHIFKKNVSRTYSQKVILYFLEAMVNCNREWIRRNPKTPSLYKSGCRYVREYETEEWLDIPTIILAGGGDCEDLACWRVAELRNQGIKCQPFIRWRKFGDFYLYHVLVLYPNGRMEDPSKILGMNGENQ